MCLCVSINVTGLHRKRECVEALKAHPEGRRGTDKMTSRMEPRLECRRRETQMLVERAQGVMRESRKLLEQREAQADGAFHRERG